MFVKPEQQLNRITNALCYSDCPTCTKPHVVCWLFLGVVSILSSYICKRLSFCFVEFENSFLLLIRSHASAKDYGHVYFTFFYRLFITWFIDPVTSCPSFCSGISVTDCRDVVRWLGSSFAFFYLFCGLAKNVNVLPKALDDMLVVDKQCFA